MCAFMFACVWVDMYMKVLVQVHVDMCIGACTHVSDACGGHREKVLIYF